jgi:hypothetical protein
LVGKPAFVPRRHLSIEIGYFARNFTISTRQLITKFHSRAQETQEPKPPFRVAPARLPARFRANEEASHVGSTVWRYRYRRRWIELGRDRHRFRQWR